MLQSEPQREYVIVVWEYAGSLSRMQSPSPELLCQVRADLVSRGSSLKAFCEAQGFSRVAVTQALSGARTGPTYRALLKRFMTCLQEADG